MHFDRVFLHERPTNLHCGLHYGRADVSLHSHAIWEVIYQRTGNIRTLQGEDVFEMHPGMVLIHPPGIPHADYASSPYTLYFFLIDLPAMPPWPRVCSDDQHESIRRVFEAIYRETRSESPDRDAMVALLVSQLDLLLRRAYVEQERTPAERMVAEAQQIIEDRFRDSPTVAEIASEIGVSRSTLYAHFTRLRGQTPPDYLHAVRMRQALWLLRHSRLTLESVADHCGFHSASHLSRHVKSATGKSPGALRKSAATALAAD